MRSSFRPFALNLISFLFGGFDNQQQQQHHHQQQQQNELHRQQDGNGDEHQQHKSKYWGAKSAEEVIVEADRLYARGQFLEVYELLNRLKFSDNAEIQWRISRSLFKMSRSATAGPEQRREMIEEAHELLQRTLALDGRIMIGGNVYKWSAIIGDERAGLMGLEARVANYAICKDLLQRAVELNPSDSTSYHLLGRWCFEMSRLSWLERAIARLLYGPIPVVSYEEAIHYLQKSSDCVPSAYMLGEICFRMRQYYRARFYLNVAATLPARTDHERRCADKARHLLMRLAVYDLSRETVLFEYPF
ncbi:PREDICTED: regulator of microtubule dynamics protein 1-like [Nicrophorus vespilloides]|uniref:Regulator of microtubule dynamics protein 1 n=1 Tax=Nicrophorus vespilloides TaxID=110193 RepID=A0ABM1NFF0_NICVS|nr:PREDICTED: regulator of microtubule dynamics protein 1-like [Nicrophorus vespilloides]